MRSFFIAKTTSSIYAYDEMDDQNNNSPGQQDSTKRLNKPGARPASGKVIQPTEAILKDVKSQPATTSADQHLSTPGIATPPQPAPASQIANNQTVPAINSKDEIPVGASASSLGLNTSSRNGGMEWGRFLKKALVVTAVLLFIGGGGLFIKNSLTGLGTKTLSNDGYTYTFKFNKSAKQVQLSNGSVAYKYLDNIIAGVKPTKDRIPVSCSEIGTQWKEAFTVQVNGSRLPVCTPNDESYSMHFTALNQNHLFTVVYNEAQTSSVYPTLETVFGSVKVSQ